jgi:hypothetical protein
VTRLQHVRLLLLQKRNLLQQIFNHVLQLQLLTVGRFFQQNKLVFTLLDLQNEAVVLVLQIEKHL